MLTQHTHSRRLAALLLALPSAASALTHPRGLHHPLRPATAAAPRITMQTRQPWDFPRFLQTAAFFNGPDQLLKRVLPSPPRTSAADPALVWSAQQPTLLEWGPLDDVVMGGVSKSGFEVRNGVGVFSGEISTDNNGGFAGCRSRAIAPALQLSRYSGLKMRVRGDGQRYKLIVRDDYNWNGIAWAYSFDTTAGSDEAEEVFAPWGSFVPTLFARRVPGVQLKTNSITTVQLTLSKFEYDSQLNPSFSTGPFKLEIESIEAY